MDNELFIEYPKMKTLFKLIPCDEKGKKWDATTGEILPETAPLHFIPLNELIFTEKIDGTNMGIKIFKDGCAIQKRTGTCNRDDNGDKYYFEIGDRLSIDIFNRNIEQLQDVIIYGELCGPKIQNGGNYFSERKFLIFDIYNTVTNKFFTWDAVKHFAQQLQIETVPEINYTKENLNVDNIKDFILNLNSVFNPNFGAEGMVIRHAKDTAATRRWMAKIRKKDFIIKKS